MDLKKYRYTMQFACFDCRKSFKQVLPDPYKEDQPERKPVCPECGKKMWEMGRTFKAPRQNDLKQWRKVEALVKRGITFHSYGSHGWGRFPKVLREVVPFVERIRRKTAGERLLRKILIRNKKTIG